ncbi:serine/threonine-protein kinase [Megalodesulfovibrio gigas]|uniref:Uncharacterized protein n=1 Tax=Megalodesulfovibrio gigas (strain ATCC 19364 / DSM 1382 / NCIMB 9332 / VKM B-1759) TaxID=1121448 RepID=T2G766_MEGG1|nr:hypothetical protein [Megalodesulfovibrio gigas]AGW12098.1 hypothetical protein DGI_0161 [Megalodesulfovibrio gigas DSM 1382 = ATCC 19364]
MTILLCFSDQRDLAGVHSWPVPLGQAGDHPVAVGGGWRRQMHLAGDLSGGRRRCLALPGTLSRGGAARRGECAMLQAIVAGGGRGQLGITQALTAGSAGRLALRTSMDAAPLQGRTAVETMSPAVRGRLACPAVCLPPLVAQSPSRRVLLDGEDISHRLRACTIRQDREDPHLRLTLAGVDAALAERLDRIREAAAPVLVVEALGRAWRFVVTAVAREDHLATVQAASAGILLDAPHAGAVSLETGAGPRSAREAATAVLAPASLCWEMEDFPLPAWTSLHDTPVTLAARIASAAGGVLRSTAEGGFRIRPRHPHGPAILPLARATLQVRAEETLLGLTVTDDPGQPWGAVHVLGAAGEAATPLVELEHVGGAEAVVRVYWRITGPDVLRLAPWVSAGRVQRLGPAVEAMAERVSFVAGQATASRPVLRLLQSPAWVGSHGGAVQAGGRSEMLQAAAGVHGLADIRYLTAFDRYLLREVDQAEALFVMGVAPAGAVAVTVRSSLRPDPTVHPVHPDVLEEPLAGSRRAAVLAAEAVLLGTCLPRRMVTARIPCDPTVEDGMLVRVQSAGAGVDGHFSLVGWSLHCEGASCIHTLEGVSWRM